MRIRFGVTVQLTEQLRFRNVGWKRAGRLFLALMLVLALLSGCGSKTAKSRDGVVTLDIAASMPETDYRTSFLADFASSVEEESGGTIKMVFHYNDEYPDQTNILKAMNSGRGKVDLGLIADPYLADYSIPDVYVSGLPYIFDDYDAVFDFMDSDVNKEIEDKLPAYGMRVLAHFDGGFRSIAAVRPINEPEDLKGLTVGTVKSPVLMDMLSTLGADPQVAVSTESQDALAKGVYNAYECSAATYEREENDRYLPYLAITNHAYNLWSILILEDSWKLLSKEQQQLMLKAAKECELVQREANRQHEEELIQTLEDRGVTVTRPDYEPFMQATKEVRERYAADYAETYKKTMEFLTSRK